MTSERYCRELLNAQEEAEVSSIVENIVEGHNVEWVPIGRQENNYGVVESQASSPLGALTELISNSVDAVLRKRYRDLYDNDYRESHNIQSYKEASKELLTDDNEEIRIKADGQLPRGGGQLNLTVEDTGEGQPPDAFEDTFVGLLKPGMSKQGWPFLQGQFGMGSTAVLPHCGLNGYKLICSAGMEQPKRWSWTLIRKNKPGNAYEYLRIDGSVPHFEGELREREIGTLIKLYNYELGSKSNITNYMRYDLARVITQSPVPIRMVETRYDGRKRYAHVVGLKTLINRNDEYVERRQTVRHDFGPPLGERDVEIVIFKDDKTVKKDEDLKLQDGKQRMFVSRRKQQNRSIFFTVNGQVHGDLGMSFVKNRCDKYHTGKDLMAFVDFSDLGPAELTDLFKPSRDRLTQKQVAKRLEDGMEELLKNDPVVKQIENKRREEFTKDKREEKLGDMLEDLVSRNPQLLDYLQEGDRINKVDDGSDSDDSGEYVAPFFPDSLKIITSKLGGEYEFWEKDDRYTVEVPVNRNSWLRLFLNAPNDFFTRENQAGKLIATPNECLRSWGLSNGQLSLQLRPLPNVEPGTSYPMTIRVDAEGMEELEEKFTLKFTEPVEKSESNANGDVPPIESLEFPEIQTVTEDEWDDHWGDWNEQTPVQIEGTKSDNMTIWVNYDAGPLLNFMSRYNLRKTGKETIKETWKAGVAIYTLSTYLELRNEFEDEDVDSREIASVSMKGVSQSMLDQHLSSDELEKLTV